MNGLERFEEMARRARAEAAPGIDVAERVAHRLRGEVLRRVGQTPLWVMTGLSVTAALIVLGVGLAYSGASGDPWAELFEPLTLVMR